jgi:hypothetical protein
MVPLFRLIEVALWEQVHVREFQIYGWEFRFNNPDFLNAVELATVHLRYKQMGAYSANDIRYALGKPKRTDENGDLYEDQLKRGQATPNPQGNPPEGRPVEPDDPSQTGEPDTEPDDPERGDQHNDVPRMLMLQELRQWRTFQLKRLGKSSRPFQTNYIPEIIRDAIQADLVGLGSEDAIRNYFGEAEQILVNGLSE